MERPIRILLLEDVAEDAELAQRELRRGDLAFETHVVSTREAFAGALAAYRPDLVLSDFVLPQMDGLSAIAMVREHDPNLPVIVLSGTIGEEQAIDTLKAGATDYVLKDRMGRLGLAVRRALREAQDREKRRRAEGELRQSEQLYRTVVNALGEGVLLAYADERIASCNARGERILGLPAAAIVGRSLSDPGWRFLAEDGVPLPAEQHPALTTLRTGLAVDGMIVGLERGDGQLLWLSVNSQPVFGSGGERPDAVVCSFADVTEQRTLGEQLRQSQKLESIGQLAGGIAHDFNNLMTVVTGYSELLLSRLKPGDPLRGEIEEVQRAGNRAAALTQQLLAFSRKQILVPRNIDLNRVIGSLLPMLRRLVREDVRILFHPGERLGAVRADPGQIEQVLLNLSSNAADAMPHGGTLTFETEVVELDADYARRHVGVKPGTHVRLSVSDTGSGMDASTQARMFEPFYTTKEKGKGTGLGLATVYGIVVGSSRVDLQACKLEYSIVSPK